MIILGALGRLMRDIIRYTIIAAFVVGLLATLKAYADYAVTQGSGTNFASKIISSVHYASQLICDATVGETQCAQVNSNNSLLVDANSSSTLHADITSPIAAQLNTTTTIGQVGSQVNIAPADCSLAIATGSTSQFIVTTSATLHGFTIQNIDSSAGGGEVIWFSLTGQASASTLQSYVLIPPSGTTQAGGSYTAPFGFGSSHGVQVVAATTGHKISCTTW